MQTRRILVGIGSCGDASMLVALGRVLPDWEIRFVGVLNTQGQWARREGLVYHRLPRHAPYEPIIGFDTPDYVSDLSRHGFIDPPPPPGPRRAAALLGKSVAQEIADFRPHMVLCSELGSALAYHLCRAAKVYGIEAWALHTLFSGNCRFLLPRGPDYGAFLRTLPLTPQPSVLPVHVPRLPDGHFVEYGSGSWAAKRAYFQRSLERLWLLARGGPSLDSWAKVAARLGGRLLPPVLHALDTLPNGFDESCAFALVLLHHPFVENNYRKWYELIELVLAAVPDDCRIVLRPHPAEPWRKALPNALIAELKRRGAMVSRPSGPLLPVLTKNARVVFTLSSTAAFGALEQGTPVFTTEQAYYTRAGMAQKVSLADAPKLRHVLAQGGAEKPDTGIVRAFQQALMQSFAVTMADPSLGVRQVAEILQRFDSKLGQKNDACCYSE